MLGSEELVDLTVDVVARSSRSSSSTDVSSSVASDFAGSESSCRRMLSRGNCRFDPVLVSNLRESEELGIVVSP